MPRLISVAAVVATALAMAAPPASARRAHLGAAGKRALDVRAGQRTPVPVATRVARRALAQQLGAEGVLASDPVGGGIRTIVRTDGFLSGPRAGDPAAIALAYVRAHAAAFGVTAEDVAALRLVVRTRSRDGVTHLTWVPASDGVPAYDTELRVHVTADGRVLAASGPSLGGLSIASARPALSPSQALGIAQNDLGAPIAFPAARTRAGAERSTVFANGDRARLVAFAAPDGDRLAWRLTVAGRDPYLYDEVVDAQTGAVLARHSLTDFAVSNAEVFDDHPDAAPAHTVDIAPWLTNPSGAALSGPNVHAYADVNDNGNGTDGAPVEIGPSAGTDWDYPLQAVAPGSGVTCAPWSFCTWGGTGATVASETTNRAQVTTEVFYLANAYHDWLEQPAIGFDNASGNFEVGGSGGSDPVKAETDDSILGPSRRINNANMSTPPDGQSPTMQMYLFTTPFPAVNGGDDASVVLHEYTHGLSNRLIGNGDGLTDKQPSAMGEGWSDWYAMDYLVAHGFVADTTAAGEVAVGGYATGDPVHGIRFQALDCPAGSTAAACPGSANAGHDGGFTFADLGRVGGVNASTPSFEVHDDGEIWSETLWDLRTALMAAEGASTGAADARELITNAMRLSPPNPSYLDERDAILAADVADFGGAHHALLWQVFAVRGMGYGARTTSPNATRGLASFATPALAEVAGTTVADATPPFGDGDGVAEPGETVQVGVRLTDPALVSLTGVHATLSSAAAGVDVQAGETAYPTIAPGDGAAPTAPFTVALAATLGCGLQVPFTLHVTSDQGTIDLPVAVPLGSGRGSFTATDVPRAIPDASPGTGASSTLVVPSGGRIDTLRVTVSIAHTFDGDLSASLTAPSGRSVELFEQPGELGSARDGFASVTFDDAAGPSIQDVDDADGAALTGAFRPDEPLAAFAGEDRAGTWTLRVIDAFAQDVGSITGWSLDTDQPSCATLPALAGGGGGVGGGGPLGPAPGSTPARPRAIVAHRTARARLDGHARFAFRFRARPHRAHGTMRLTLPGTRHLRTLLLATPRFTVSPTGRVRVVVTARGAALARLRRLHDARVTVTIVLGGRRFSSTLRLAA